MNLTTIEDGQPEQNLNSEQKVQDKQVSPSTANALVVGSREIKFRAWNIIVGRMQYFTLEDIEKQSDKIQWHILQITQYTGLKDKNGKEIYEGDIVEANGHETILVKDNSEARKFVSPIFKDEYKSKDGRFLFVVYWQECFSQFSFNPLNKMVSINCDVNKRDLEIIGNIFENPELLQTLR